MTVVVQTNELESPSWKFLPWPALDKKNTYGVLLPLENLAEDIIHGKGIVTCVVWDFMAQYTNSIKYICLFLCETLPQKTQQV